MSEDKTQVVTPTSKGIQDLLELFHWYLSVPIGILGATVGIVCYLRADPSRVQWQSLLGILLVSVCGVCGYELLRHRSEPVPPMRRRVIRGLLLGLLGFGYLYALLVVLDQFLPQFSGFLINPVVVFISLLISAFCSALIWGLKEAVWNINAEAHEAVDERIRDYADALQSSAECVNGSLRLQGFLDTACVNRRGTLCLKVPSKPAQCKNCFEPLAKKMQKRLPPLEALLRGWNRRLNASETSGAAKLSEVWAGIFNTYFHEEAYDINRGEIVTNARNYPFLLLSITKQMMEAFPEDVIHFATVTPVSPKDWLNWPYGSDAKPKYYENWFIALYYRAIAGMIAKDKAKKRLRHERFVVCRSDSVTEERTLGWPLDKTEKLTEHLTWRIFPQRTPIWAKDTSAEADTDSVISQIRAALGVKEDDAIDAKNVLFGASVVPVKPQSKDPKSALAADVEKLTEQWCDTEWDKINARNCEKINQAVHTKIAMIEAKIAKLNDVGRDHANAIWQCAQQEHHPVERVDLLQRLDACLAAHSLDNTDHEVVAQYLNHVLSSGDSRLAETTVGQWFANTLHSEPSLAKRLVLDDAQITNWKAARLPAEFALWGTYDTAKKKTTWMMGLTSSIAYPYETSCLHIVSDDVNAALFQEMRRVVDPTTCDSNQTIGTPSSQYGTASPLIESNA